MLYGQSEYVEHLISAYSKIGDIRNLILSLMEGGSVSLPLAVEAHSLLFALMIDVVEEILACDCMAAGLRHKAANRQ